MMADGKPLFAKAIVKNLEEVKKAESLKGDLVTAEPTLFELIAIWVTKYAALLILIGIAGMYLELQAPGFGLPGMSSIAAFSLFFFGHYVAGSLVGQETAVAVAVFVVGVVLIALELTLFPGTMLLGVVGFGCVMVALVYTMSGWDVLPTGPVVVPGDGTNPPPAMDFRLATYALGLRNFSLGILGAAMVIFVAVRYLPETQAFRRLVLHSTAGGSTENTPEVTALRAVKSGDEGRTVSALRPYGTVQFGETRVEAMVEGGYLQSGTSVRVREVAGGRIVVEGVG